ncbi:MAG: T9SS type A sorting domain-containing protein, partial [candidate division WOR-3 bacterium]
IHNYVSDEDSVNALFVDQFGNAYVTGYSYSIEGDMDWVTIKYNSEGEQVWMARHSTFDEDDDAWAVVVNPIGDVFVAGYDYLEGSEDYAVVKYSEPDVGVARIVEPADTFRLDATVVPRAWVRNYGAMALTFPVRLEIGNFYFDVQNVNALPPYDSLEVRFEPWLVRDVGTHTVKVYTMLASDKEPENDTSYGTVTTVPVWEQLSDLPAGSKNKAVKDGGALAFVQDSLVFAFKGNNRVEFYCYNLNRREWRERESIPAIGRSGAKKRVKKGAQLEPDTAGNIYAFKGNNTLEFWRYSIAGNSWLQLRDYPASGTNRKIKGGSGLVFVPSLNRFYGNRGANTCDFYAYDVTGDSWIRRQDIPLGDRGRKAKDGTAIVYDGDSTIYLLKGGTYEFWAYRIGADSWVRKKDIRDSQLSNRRKKVKNGAALAYDPNYQRVYAFKGGKQTEFWFFDVARDSWVETVDTLPLGPSRRGPYGGADLVFGNGKLYALKGNKTREFWMYHANFPLNPPLPKDGECGVSVPLPRIRLAVAPNPISGSAQIGYILPQPGRVRLAMFDVTGRRRLVLAEGEQPEGEHQVTLDASGLAAGVYLVRLDCGIGSEKMSVNRKVLVTR